MVFYLILNGYYLESGMANKFKNNLTKQTQCLNGMNALAFLSALKPKSLAKYLTVEFLYLV